MRRRTRRSSALLPEQLEERVLLSATGNVSVEVDAAGNLLVAGDDSSNAVWIKQDDGHAHYGAGTIWVWGDGTTINGQSYDMDNPLGVDGFSANITASLGGGNDIFYVYGVHTPGGMTISLGDGANEAYVDRTSVEKSLLLLGGHGTDQLYVDNVTVGGKLRVRAFRGKDNISVTNVQTRNMNLHSGPGKDGVYVYDVNVSGH